MKTTRLSMVSALFIGVLLIPLDTKPALAQASKAATLKDKKAVTGIERGENGNLPARSLTLKAVAAERTKTASARKTPDIRVGGFRVRVNGRSCSGTMVQVRLDTVRIKVGLGGNQVGLTESLASMAKRYRALAGINGSYRALLIESTRGPFCGDKRRESGLRLRGALKVPQKARHQLLPRRFSFTQTFSHHL